jgi:hypothetical protein
MNTTAKRRREAGHEKTPEKGEFKMKRLLTIGTVLLTLVVPAFAAGSKAPPDSSYKKVSTLVALPDFIPGMGTLYVKPVTLPVGPFLAYDRGGTLVATIYMVPLKDMQDHKDFTGLAAGSHRVKQVDITFNPGHAGVPVPHYHVTIWHVDPDQAKLK